MKTTMLEYVKIILNKVSFDSRLFRKEYRKSLQVLTRDEANQLRTWLRQNNNMLESKYGCH